MAVYLTCDSPRCTDAVSEMYMIFPSAERTKMNPSRVWRRWEPNSLRASGRLVTAGFMPQPSPRPAVASVLRNKY